MRTLIALGLAASSALGLVAAVPGGGAGAAEDGSPVITWSRTGGIAGVHQTLRIGTGRLAVAAEDGTRREMRLSRRRYARLRGLLDDARLSSLHRRYPAPGAADTFRYAVAYRGSTVSADETKVPERLRPALTALSGLFGDVTARPAFRDPRRAELAAARRRWRAAGLRSYRFRLRVTCYCPGAGTRRTIRVRDGRPHGGKGADTVADTVPEMFHRIAAGLRSDRAGEVRARYDTRLGYPRRVFIDQIEKAIDDELSWTADRLRAAGR